MKTLGILLFAFGALAAQGSDLLQLSSDKSSYDAGDTAYLRAMVATRPSNPSLEFDLTASLNGNAIETNRVTDFEFYSIAENLAPGSYSYEAELVIQDKRLARDLKNSVAYYSQEIARVDAELAVETDPTRISELQAEKAQYENLKAVSEQSLQDIRTTVYGPITHTFDAQ